MEVESVVGAGVQGFHSDVADVDSCVEDSLGGPALRFLAEVAASGLYSGVEFAVLLMRADVRAHVAAWMQGGRGLRLGSCLVQKLERDTIGEGLPVFFSSVASMAVVHRVYGPGAPVSRAAVYSDKVWLSLSVAVQTPQVAIAGLGGKILDKSVVGLKPVVPVSVYRAIIRIPMRMAGHVPTVSVGVVSDGVRVVDAGYDPTAAVSVSDLPEGKYVLPGGFGRLVDRDVMRDLLYNVLVVPALMHTEGYCYLKTLPVEDRVLAATILGWRPTAERLHMCFPSATRWARRDAECLLAADEAGEPLCHVVREGNLPAGLPAAARVGGLSERDPGKALLDSVTPLLKDAFGSSASVLPELERSREGFSVSGVAAVRGPVGLSVASRPGPTGQGPGSVASSSHLSSLGIGKGAGSTSSFATTVSSVGHKEESVAKVRYVPAAAGDDTGWRLVDQPLVHEWRQRLSGGAPLGRRCISALVKSSEEYLPNLPSNEGRTLVLPRTTVSSSAKQARWDPVRCPVPGWSLERLKSEGGTEVFAVPPEAKVVCRYEFSSNGDMAVGGYRVGGHRTTLWVSGAFSFRLSDKKALLWRFIPHVGADVLGPAMLNLLRLYSALVVREWTGMFSGQVVVPVRIQSESGTRSKYTALRHFSSGVTRVLVHMSGGVTGPVLLRVGGEYLSSVEMHGVLMRPVNHLVSVILEACNMSIAVDVGAAAVGGDVIFEVVHQPEVRLAYKALPPVDAGG